jgi:hypothetical protein
VKIQKNTILGATIEHQFDYNGELHILANAGRKFDSLTVCSETYWPVAITIREDRIEASVWAVAPNNAPLRIREGSGLGWTLREESSSPNDPGAYEFVGVEDYRREGWIRLHHMGECAAISVRQDYKLKDGKMNLSGWHMTRWEEGRGLNNGFIGPYSGEEVRGDMRQRIQAYMWLMERVDELLDRDSDIRRHAEAMRLQNEAEHSRRDYENAVKESNRPLVIGDCHQEIRRADKCLWPVFKVTDKQQVALDAAIYGLAMGEDYTKAGEGWIDKVREGRRFSPKDVEEYYPEATEFNGNVLFSGGVLVNMWNALGTHPQRAEIADYADKVLGAIKDMKATHDKSEAQWFMFQIKKDAYAENATQQKEVK